MIDGVQIIEPDAFTDHRGDLWTIWKEGDYNLKFNHDKVSTSKKNVLRGIHGDNKTWKLISCLYGKFYLLVVNNDKQSKQYKKWASFILDDKKKHMVLVPPRFGNGHYVLSNKAIFYYKQNTFYNQNFSAEMNVRR